MKKNYLWLLAALAALLLLGFGSASMASGAKHPCSPKKKCVCHKTHLKKTVCHPKKKHPARTHPAPVPSVPVAIPPLPVAPPADPVPVPIPAPTDTTPPDSTPSSTEPSSTEPTTSTTGPTTTTEPTTEPAPTTTTTEPAPPPPTTEPTTEPTTTTTTSPPPPPPPPPSGNWWVPDSPFNTPIGSNPSVLSESANWVSQVYNSAGGINVNSGAWTTTVYHASASTPRRSFVMNNGWVIDNVPYDSSWVGSPDSDSHIAIIDDTNGCEYEFASFNPGGMTYGEATFHIDTGTGAHEGWGTTGSSLSVAGGLIRPEEIQAGQINHALAFAAPVSGSGFVDPATTSDGPNGGGPPEGSLFQLDPNLDLSQYGLNPGQLTVARAMQQYGMYLRDTSSAVAIYAESTSDGSSYGYDLGLPRDLLSHLRVVAGPGSTRLDSWSDTSCQQRHQ